MKSPIPPIPGPAMPVVRVLRRDVKRPSTRGWATWSRLNLGDQACRNDQRCCPMGLHPKSKRPAPSAQEDFADGQIPRKAVWAFGEWFDAIPRKHLSKAFDLIWGKK